MKTHRLYTLLKMCTQTESLEHSTRDQKNGCMFLSVMTLRNNLPSPMLLVNCFRWVVFWGFLVVVVFGERDNSHALIGCHKSDSRGCTCHKPDHDRFASKVSVPARFSFSP